MAVIGSFGKRMSPPHAWGMLDEIEKIMMDKGYGFTTKYVESDGNVAHSATHDEKITHGVSRRAVLGRGDEQRVPPARGRSWKKR